MRSAARSIYEAVQGDWRGLPYYARPQANKAAQARANETGFTAYVKRDGFIIASVDPDTDSGESA